MTEQTSIPVSSAPVITIPPLSSTSSPLSSSAPGYAGWWKGFVVLVCIAGLGIGGWMLYRMLFPSPEEVLAHTIAALPSVRTFHIKAAFQTGEGENFLSERIASPLSSGEDILSGATEVEEVMEGDIELMDLFDGEARFALSLSVTALQEGKRDVLIAGETIEDTEAVYTRLTEMHTSEDIFMNAVFQKVVLNQWVGDTDDVTKNFVSKLETMREQKKTEAPLTDGHITQLQQTWESSSLFSIAQEYDKEVVDGEEAYHYALSFDTQAWEDFLDQCEEIMEDTYLADESWVEDLRSFELKDVEVWISSSSFLPLHIQASVLDTAKASEMQADIFLSAYGDPVVITPPTQFMSSLEMLQKMTEGMMEYLGQDEDEDGLTNDKEMTYHTDPQDADSDDDGYSDGQEVEGGYDPNGPGKLEQGILKLKQVR